jgi:hypothetical protein
MNGVPPGSGGVALWKCPDPSVCADDDDGECYHQEPHEALKSCLKRWDGSCDRCVFVGVRFPASDPDPGRWYRGEAD